MKVLFLTNVPSPYRVDFFNELGKSCDLTVLFEKETSDERDSSWKDYSFDNFKGIILKGRSTGTDAAICFDVKKYVKDKTYDKIICSDMSTPTGIIAIFTMKRNSIPYYLEADGGVAGKRSGLKYYIKKKILSGAYGYFSTCPACDKYFETYGARPERIFRYPFTSLKKSEMLDSPVPKEEVDVLRNKLGLIEKNIIISVGRFSYMKGYGKGFDTLLKVSEKLSEDYGIYIIGDEPTEEFVNWKEEKNLEHVHFLPFKKKEKLFDYYKAADISIILSRGDVWGLVVNESMACACPVISSDACVAGVELIEEGRNGYVVPVDDCEYTYNKIIQFFASEEKKSYESAALDTSKRYSIEEMARIHIEALSKN